MTVEGVMRERARLIGWKHCVGLTDGEEARLDWLNGNVLKNCPRVTPEMKAAADAICARLDARQARREKTNHAKWTK